VEPRNGTARLFVVHRGTLRIEHSSDTGRRRLLRLADAGAVVGEHAFLTGERPTYEAQAVTDVDVCMFQHEDLAQLVASHPRVALALLRSVTARLEDAERRLGLTSMEVPQRVSAFLLDLPAAADSKGGQPSVRLPWSKRDVAAYLSTTPESFSRALRTLSSAGVIAVDGVRIRLLDMEALDS